MRKKRTNDRPRNQTEIEFRQAVYMGIGRSLEGAHTQSNTVVS